MLLSQLFKLVAASGLVSFGVSVLIVYSQQWHGPLTHDHDMTGVQKVHTAAVPRIGGVAVFAGISLGMCLFLLAWSGEIKPARVHRVLMLLVASLPAFVAGMTEDLTKNISVRVRLAATVSSSLIASALIGATVNELDIWGFDQLLTHAPIAIIVTAIVVAGGANAINIIDGFNGLSGGVILIMSVALGAVALQAGDGFVAILSALGAGSTVGFLLLNYPSGKLFLGDGGAYFLGFWVAEVAVMLLVRNPLVNAWQVLSICAYPVIEVLFSIYRRKFIRKVDPGAPDALHLHTLIYRRVVSRFIPVDEAKPWMRNAAVTCITVPWVAIAAVASVVAGQTIVGGVLLVAAQVLAYLAIYTRLVRGRWWARTTAAATDGAVSPQDEVKTNLS